MALFISIFLQLVNEFITIEKKAAKVQIVPAKTNSINKIFIDSIYYPSVVILIELSFK